MRSQLISDGSRLELESGNEIAINLKDTNVKQLKFLMRNTSIPLNDPIRNDLWRELALRHADSHQFNQEFDTEFDHLVTNKLPQFVDPRIGRFFGLNSEGKKHVVTVLWNLSQSCPHLTFAPLIYPLVSLFLHFHSPEDTFKSLLALLSSRDVHFMGSTRVDKSRDAIILVKLTDKFGILRPRKFAADAREKLRNNALDTAFAEFLQWIFVFLPFHYCVRVVDCYLIEGEKFLYRIALTLALLFEKHQKQTITLERMRTFCESITNIVTPSQLISSAVKITRLSRKDISRARTKAEMRSDNISLTDSPIPSKNDMISTKEYILGTRIAPRRFKSSILSWNDLDILWEWIPERVVVKEPVVVFCSEENGNSLQTFYTLCGDYEPTILLIKTVYSEVFGAFCSSAWSKRFDLAQTKSGQCFGTGETFLFVLSPKVAKYDWVGKNKPIESSQISHSQQLFMSASSRSLSIGSGGGKFGLYLDESLNSVESNRCDTFENEPLCKGLYFSLTFVEAIIAFVQI